MFIYNCKENANLFNSVVGFHFYQNIANCIKFKQSVTPTFYS